jgi:hypothetical protein
MPWRWKNSMNRCESCKELRQENKRLKLLLAESLSTFKMWADVAPAFSLCEDIKQALEED